MWLPPYPNTPCIDQVKFGAWGQDLPGYGWVYCGPTAVLMGLYWLYENGFTQVAPAKYTKESDPEVFGLERIVAGFMQTSVVGGTGINMSDGIIDYLSACGIAPSQYTFAHMQNPGQDFINNQLAPNWAPDPDTIVLANFSVGWFESDKEKKTLTCCGGHVLTPLAGGITTILINNPWPPSMFAKILYPQTVQTYPVPGGWSFLNFTSWNNLPPAAYTQLGSDFTGPGMTQHALMWGGQAWAIKKSVKDAPPSTWTLTKLKWFNTNGADFTVRAPLAGTGGIAKSGAGRLTLGSTNQLTGANRITGGTLCSTALSGAPFGTGPLSLLGDGLLAFSPASGAAVTATIASGAESTLVLGPGGGAITLEGTGSFNVTVGGYSDGTNGNIARLGTGTLVIAPGGGVAALGVSQQFLVNGSGDNLPLVTNGIVAPYIVGYDTAVRSAGAFLTYGSTGFAPVVPTSSAKVAIADVTPAMVYEVVTPQAVASGGSPQVYALEIDGGSVTGSGASLLVGSQAAGDFAGVVLNGGDITVDTLTFGAAEAVIYASDISGGTTIGSQLSGTGGLTLFGPGALTLSADNSSLSGPVNINAGKLIAAGAGSTGTGDVIVDSTAVLQVNGSVAGNVSVAQNGVLALLGGTLNGQLSVAASGGNNPNPGGFLEGVGTVAGSASVAGVVRSGPQPGFLTFTGAVTLAYTASFYWRLHKLVDGTTPSDGWNALQFSTDDLNLGGTIPVYLDFSALGADPDGGNASFWKQKHSWLLLQLASSTPLAIQPYGETFVAGGFDWEQNGSVVTLTWTPAAPHHDLAERGWLKAMSRMRLQPSIPLPGAPAWSAPGGRHASP